MQVLLCLLYILLQLCDTRIKEGYSAISSGKEALSVHTDQMIANEIIFETIHPEGWEVTFDKEPTKVLFGYYYLLHALSTAILCTLYPDIQRNATTFRR